MGGDTNQPGSKPRARSKSASGTADPFRRRASKGDAIELAEVPGILGAIEAVLAGGRALMLSRTSDGGAVAVHILDDGKRYKQYASTQGELNDVFADLLEAYGTDSTAS